VTERKPLYTSADKSRLVQEPVKAGAEEPYRTVWRVDFARLVHCPAFRRLQGKTQLFPGESDFFRNRLTHSLEVAQIAKSIAIKLNYEHFRDATDDDYRISTDLVEFAALAHDLGHPPFGHNGEAALDECMRGVGGFEGNAQTLRILARIEKKRTTTWPPVEFPNGEDDARRGLNLTFRTMASILKYDREILPRSDYDDLMKGYYGEEKDLVQKIKRAVTGQDSYPDFKTVECQIMDFADDIAYSTYDFEDAMKVGFTSLLDVLRLARQPELLRRIAIKVWKTVTGRKDRFDEKDVPEELREQIDDIESEILAILYELCSSIVPALKDVQKDIDGSDFEGIDNLTELALVSEAYTAAKEVQENGYLRTSLTSQLVGEFIQGIGLKVNADIPAISEVTIDERVRKKIEVLKRYTFETHIEASRLKSVEFRGKDIVKEIIACLSKDKRLLPMDWRARWEALPSQNHKLRCVCDFIAGMTDRYALEFFQRLRGDPVSIFKEP
jgi:dGTPase